MRDKLLKELISRKTRVQLVNKQSMADVPGVRNMKNRQLEWKEFNGNSNDLPAVVSQELSSITSEFNSEFHKYSDPQYADSRVIFAYYASNPAVSNQYKETLQQSNDPRKDQFLELIQWMDKYGARLFMSPRGLHRLARERGQKTVSTKSNNSDFWLENFGYIWGLKKVGDYRNTRVSAPKSDAEAEHLFLNGQDQMEENDEKLVQVKTESKNGAWGIYFSDGGRTYPVIGDNYYQHSKSKESDKDWVDYDKFGEHSGQHSKYYGVTDKDTNKVSFTYPTSSRFILPDGEDDSQPQFVHKNSVKETGKKEYVWTHDGIEETLDASLLKNTKSDYYIYLLRGQMEGMEPQKVKIPKSEVAVKKQQLYYLWVKNDGTLWWVPNESRDRAKNKDREGAESGKPFPLTKEQVDHLSLENNKWFVLSKPDKFVYSWNTWEPRTDEEAANPDAAQKKAMDDFNQKTQLMDDLYDFLSQSPQGAPPVGLQATKYCVIAPRFKRAENTGENEAKGRMKSHHTHIEDVSETGGKEFYGVRKEWVVVASEFNQARAESSGTRGFFPAQSISGLGPVSGFANVTDAVHKAFSSWRITAPYPDQATLENAQAAFEHATSGKKQTIEQPDANIQVQQPPLPQKQQRIPNIPTPNINRYVGTDDDIEERSPVPVLASVNCLNKTAKHLLKQFRRIS